MSENNIEAEKPAIKRREFLTGLIHSLMGVWGIFAAMGAGYTGLRYLWPSKSMGKEETGGKLNILISDIPKGDMLKVKYRGAPIGIIERGGQYYALSIVCTHLGCIVTLDPNISDNLYCPCHASLFDIHGNVLDGPAPKPLQTYPVEIVNDRVIIG